MDEDIDIKSKGYTISMTNLQTKKQVVCSLSPHLEKWVVKGEGYQGYFTNLEGAYREACRHLKYQGNKTTKENET